MRTAVAAYGVFAYAAFLATFAYVVGFLANVAVPKSIDGPPGDSLVPAVLVDAALVALFGVQHSVMARRSFKEAWTRIVPSAAERSTYVLASTLVFVVLCWQWRPVPIGIWSLSGPLAWLAWALFGAGWALVLAASYMIDHADWNSNRRERTGIVYSSDVDDVDVLRRNISCFASLVSEARRPHRGFAQEQSPH